METEISEFSYMEAVGDIYIIGGEIRSNSEGYLSYSKKAFALNDHECRELNPMNNGRCGHRLNYIKRTSDNLHSEHLIIATGSKYPEDNSSNTEVYNIVEDKWINGPEMRSSRFHHTSVVVAEQILYVVGGRHAVNEKKTLDSIEKLDFSVEEPSWVIINFSFTDTFWTPRDTPGAFVVDDKEIVIFGGNHGWQSECFIYNIAKDEIKRSDQYLKKAEEFIHAQPCEYKGKIYIIGGCDKDIHIYLKHKWYLMEKDFIEW
mmetsp:Transcript_4896/g.4147  ORF Transcript_4896/g.4147 Transcript_4896/m.4147 type:complete len:260 (+) Transcript_4896:543-1322(+)